MATNSSSMMSKEEEADAETQSEKPPEINDVPNRTIINDLQDESDEDKDNLDEEVLDLREDIDGGTETSPPPSTTHLGAASLIEEPDDGSEASPPATPAHSEGPAHALNPIARLIYVSEQWTMDKRDEFGNAFVAKFHRKTFEENKTSLNHMARGSGRSAAGRTSLLIAGDRRVPTAIPNGRANIRVNCPRHRFSPGLCIKIPLITDQNDPRSRYVEDRADRDAEGESSRPTNASSSRRTDTGSRSNRKLRSSKEGRGQGGSAGAVIGDG
jgi:hypothetical protein